MRYAYVARDISIGTIETGEDKTGPRLTQLVGSRALARSEGVDDGELRTTYEIDFDRLTEADERYPDERVVVPL